jgi:hypothetical protein
MVTVRSEFRGDVLEVRADDPVFGTGCCRVAGCERHSRGQGLCQGHRLRWVHAGRPDLDVFAATTYSRWHRQQPNQRCRVRGCGYGVARQGLCALHARHWLRAGRPEFDSGLHNHPAVMNRDALVPIDTELRELITEHRQRTTERWPAGTPRLFPRPTKNIDGTHPIASPTYRMALERWLDACDIRDEHGNPVHLTPHQWRHILGTRLINRDVPQEVVRRILETRLPADDRALHPAA